jgi:hypothetical protein
MNLKKIYRPQTSNIGTEELGGHAVGIGVLHASFHSQTHRKIGKVV